MLWEQCQHGAKSSILPEEKERIRSLVSTLALVDLCQYHHTTSWCCGPRGSPIWSYLFYTEADFLHDVGYKPSLQRHPGEGNRLHSTQVQKPTRLQIPMEGGFLWIPQWCIGMGAGDEWSHGESLHNASSPICHKTSRRDTPKLCFDCYTTYRVFPDHQFAFCSNFKQRWSNNEIKRFSSPHESRPQFSWCSWPLEGLEWVPSGQTWRTHTRPGHRSYLSASTEDKQVYG